MTREEPTAHRKDPSVLTYMFLLNYLFKSYMKGYELRSLVISLYKVADMKGKYDKKS
jgi:hypothetical protein